MKKKFLIGIAGLTTVLIALRVYLMTQSDRKERQLRGIINVDQVVVYPERFTGYIGVAGKVIETKESIKLFILGCEDACVRMPVRYSGHLPEVGKEVVVYGQIKKDENKKYIFEANEIK